MTCYRFNIYDGGKYLDREGTELADLQAAHGEAMRFAGELLIHEGERVIANGGCLIVVKDEQDATQFRLDLTLALTPGIANTG